MILSMWDIVEILRSVGLRDDEGGVIITGKDHDPHTKCLDFIESSFPWETPWSPEGRRLSMQFVEADIEAGKMVLRMVSWENATETGAKCVTNILETPCAFPYFFDPRAVALLCGTKMLFEQLDADRHQIGLLPRDFFLTGSRDPMNLKKATTAQDFYSALRSRLNKLF